MSLQSGAVSRSVLGCSYNDGSTIITEYDADFSFELVGSIRLITEDFIFV